MTDQTRSISATRATAARRRVMAAIPTMTPAALRFVCLALKRWTGIREPPTAPTLRASLRRWVADPRGAPDSVIVRLDRFIASNDVLRERWVPRPEGLETTQRRKRIATSGGGRGYVVHVLPVTAVGTLPQDVRDDIESLTDWRACRALAAYARNHGSRLGARFAFALAGRARRISENVGTLNTFGSCARAARAPRVSVEAYEASLARDPDPRRNPRAHTGLAAALADMGRYERAKALARAVVDAGSPADAEFAIRVLRRIAWLESTRTKTPIPMRARRQPRGREEFEAELAQLRLRGELAEVEVLLRLARRVP